MDDSRGCRNISNTIFLVTEVINSCEELSTSRHQLTKMHLVDVFDLYRWCVLKLPVTICPNVVGTVSVVFSPYGIYMYRSE